MSVYTLECRDQRFYVGFSTDVLRRVAEHFFGRGALWTRLHPPTKVVEIVTGDRELENAKTIALMARFGWQNVRGGNYCSLVLKTMPPPLARALAYAPPRPLALPSDESYEFEEHLVHLRRASAGWIARVSGPLTIACTSGVKVFKATSEDCLRLAVEQWIVQSRVVDTVSDDVSAEAFQLLCTHTEGKDEHHQYEELADEANAQLSAHDEDAVSNMR